MKLSICIPTYNAEAWVRQCLASIYAHAPAGPFEILLVDDCSSDGTLEAVSTEFPQVRICTNPTNLGFSRSINAGVRQANGSSVLVLNNDTQIHPAALDTLVRYLDEHPRAGIVGPKVLSADGSLQQQCRRRIPTPWGAFAYFTGLSRRFPQNPRFRGYLVTEADENQTIEVDAVSGSCMLVRRTVFDQIGYFDEDFFLYGEDLDFCHRANVAGWKVVYHPAASITHFGGQGGTGVRRLHSTIQFHRAMWLFYRKHLASRAIAPERALVYFGIALKGALEVTANAVRRSRTPGTAKPQSL